MNAKTITLFSNKGGVGKTFIAVNLAAALAISKKKVLLLDFDLQAGQDMARVINLSPKASIIDLLPRLETIEKIDSMIEFVAVHSSGVHFLPAVRGIKQINHVTPDNIKPFIRKAKEFYDYILIDAGRSFSETLITLFDYSNLLLLVATPDILAVYQIKTSIDILQNLQFPLKIAKLILNRSESSGSVAWQEIRTALPCEIFSHIPSDGKVVGLALNRGIPCVLDSPKSKVAESFMRMAQMIEKDKDLFVESTDIEKQRAVESVSAQGQFWENFGISQHVADAAGAITAIKEDDEITILKKKIHEKLIERLNLDGITPEKLNDPQTIARVKKTSEQLVGNLLMEEMGGKQIASHEERIHIVKDVVNEALGLGL